MTSPWNDASFDPDDELNHEIWRESPARGAALASAHAEAEGGGWQDRWARPPLPWVPDLVGRRWRERGGVVVLGSAYAPFVGGGGRHATLPLASYVSARSPWEFGSRFLRAVVQPDATYYRGVQELLDGLVAVERSVVSDLCRVSFVAPTADGFRGGDEVVRRSQAQFDAWVDAGADWTIRRLQESGARVVVVLGELAWWTLRRVLADAGVALGDERWGDFARRHPATRGGEFVLGGVKRYALRVAHPSWRNKHDPAYAGARQALASLLGVRLTRAPASGDATAAPQPARERSARASAGRREVGGDRVVGLHFVCRGSLNVRELPDGTFESGVWVVADQHARTAEYLALHESKSQWSYRQGRILGYRTVEHEGRTRLVFRVAPEPVRRAWVGGGSGEKGYCYG